MAILPPGPPTQVGVREFRAHMGAYMERVAAGEAITLLSRGKPVAVVNPAAPVGLRPWGLMKGKIEYLTEDWDKTDPEDIALMNGDD